MTNRKATMSTSVNDCVRTILMMQIYQHDTWKIHRKHSYIKMNRLHFIEPYTKLYINLLTEVKYAQY